MRPGEGREKQAAALCWVTQQGPSTNTPQLNESGPLLEKLVPSCLEVTCTHAYTKQKTEHTASSRIVIIHIQYQYNTHKIMCLYIQYVLYKI